MNKIQSHIEACQALIILLEENERRSAGLHSQIEDLKVERKALLKTVDFMNDKSIDQFTRNQTRLTLVPDLINTIEEEAEYAQEQIGELLEVGFNLIMPIYQRIDKILLTKSRAFIDENFPSANEKQKREMVTTSDCYNEAFPQSRKYICNHGGASNPNFSNLVALTREMKRATDQLEKLT